MSEFLLSPICLFVYKRLWHSQQTVSSLLENNLAKKSELFVFSDGPKNAAEEQKVWEVRKWIKEISGFRRIHYIEQEKNQGLAKAIIEGVSTIVDQFKKVIVVEDDLIVSPYFLDYMNDALQIYEHDERVASIHGYGLPVSQIMPQTYFLPGADCWGWATWKRAWDKFEPDGNKLLCQLKQRHLLKEFDYHDTQFNTQMLKNQIAGKNNSWAIRWHASALVNNMLTLYPGKSLVRNIGLDNSGEHCTQNQALEVHVSDKPIHDISSNNIKVLPDCTLSPTAKNASLQS